MKEKVRSIAAAGNAAALVLLILILANRTVLFETPSPALPRFAGEGVLPPTRTSPILQGTGGGSLSRGAGEGWGGGPILLIVIDGLRLDRSLDPHLMPNLVRLGREGSRAIARVEALIPSTISGIRRPPGPADWRALRALPGLRVGGFPLRGPC